MIVDPDFLDHWRTQMLADMLDDPCAPQYIIRLWGHCQNRRAWVFDDMPVQAAKAICRYPGDAKEFESAMEECGFLSREGKTLSVVGWDEHNASLIKQWENGAKGGRPKKETQRKPNQNPTETQRKPNQNPVETDKIGLDRMGVDNTNMSGTPGGDAEPAIVLLPTNKHNTKGEEYPVTQSQIDEWQEVYPAVNCLAETKQAKLWLKANPTKRKTYGGMAKFLNSWMSRQQNKGGSSVAPPAAAPRPSHRNEMPKPDRPPRRE